MRLYLLSTTFSFSGVYARTFRIFMTYPLPSPIHNVEDILFNKKCSQVSLQQHCFRGEGGSKYSLKNFCTRLSLSKLQSKLYFRCLSWQESISPPLCWPSNFIMLLNSSNSGNQIIMLVTSL